MDAVVGLLKELGLDETPVLTVFNKQDRVTPQLTQNLCRLYDAIAIEARNPTTLAPPSRTDTIDPLGAVPGAETHIPAKAEGVLEALRWVEWASWGGQGRRR